MGFGKRQQTIMFKRKATRLTSKRSTPRMKEGLQPIQEHSPQTKLSSMVSTPKSGMLEVPIQKNISMKKGGLKPFPVSANVSPTTRHAAIGKKKPITANNSPNMSPDTQKGGTYSHFRNAPKEFSSSFCFKGM